jgi:hypothetical protein
MTDHDSGGVFLRVAGAKEEGNRKAGNKGAREQGNRGTGEQKNRE